jgi:hypothetical protein
MVHLAEDEDEDDDFDARAFSVIGKISVVVAPKVRRWMPSLFWPVI